jgi:hypothetical protein
LLHQAAQSRAGSARLKWKPWISSQRLRRSSSIWARVSTPSAITCMCRLCAMLMMASAMAASSGLVVMSRTKAMSIFSLSIGKRFR